MRASICPSIERVAQRLPRTGVSGSLPLRARLAAAALALVVACTQFTPPSQSTDPLPQAAAGAAATGVISPPVAALPAATPASSSSPAVTGPAGAASPAPSMTMPVSSAPPAPVQPADAAESPADASAPRPSTGCASSRLEPGRTTGTIESGGVMRSYILYVPRGYDGTTPVPLLLDFHGATVDASSAEMGSGFKPLADAKNFIYLAPNGRDRRWEQRDPDGDVPFVRELVAAIGEQGCIDQRRVYSTGCSSGGGFTYLLMCNAEDLIAAVAPMCGTPFFNIDTECMPDRPVPHILFLGRNDFAGCWEGTYQALGPNQVACAKEVQRVLRSKYACKGDIRMTHDGLCETVDQCAQGSEVVICGTDTGHVVYSPQVAEAAWEFLERFAMP